MNSQIHTRACSLASWHDSHHLLRTRPPKPDDAGPLTGGRISSTTTDNERQLLQVIRQAARQGQPQPHDEQSSGDHRDWWSGLRPGMEVGDYRLIAELGEGAFAKVFLAFHESMQRLVAIKFSTRPSHEPKLLSSLSHPHIVRVYHYDDQCLAEHGIYLLYMEYAHGVDLRQLLLDAGSVPIPERDSQWLTGYLSQIRRSSEGHCEVVPAVGGENATWAEVVARIGAGIADALAYAHGHHVLHRDIKPANVLLRTDGSPMLVDFNVGYGEHVSGAQPQECFGGSPGYMAPEQWRALYQDGNAAAVDHRCDLYSLGVLLYEMLTGEVPDSAKSMQSDCGGLAGRREGRAASDGGGTASDPLSRCPVGLRDIVQRCLATSPAGRPQSAQFVARRLEICSSSAMHEYVFASAGSWGAMAARHPVVALLAVVLVPNGVFAILNIAFVDQYASGGFYLETPSHWTTRIGYFEFQKWIVNACVFPVGIWTVIRFARPLVQGLPVGPCRTVSQQSSRAAAMDRETSWQCAMRLGRYVWLVVLACWIGTGIAFPTWNCLAKWHYVSETLSPRDFATFFMTQVTFGTMASALSVLGLNFVMVQWLLPVLLREDPVPNATCLDPISRQVRRMVHWLAVLPQFSLLAVALLIADRNPTLLVMLGLVSGVCYCSGILYARFSLRAAEQLRALLPPI